MQKILLNKLNFKLKNLTDSFKKRQESLMKKLRIDDEGFLWFDKGLDSFWKL